MRKFFVKIIKSSMVKRSFALFYAFIITSFFVISQYNIAFAAEAGAIETVAVTVGSLYSAIKSGEAAYVLTDFFEKAVVFASEVRTERFVPSDTLSEFYNSYMLSLDEKIDSGDLVEADVGEVLYVGGKPVAFSCPTLGCYAFFCNKEIAERIDNYSAEKTIGNVRALVEEYWDDEFFRIRRPNFDVLVADPENWRCCFDVTSIGVDGSANVDVIFQSFFETFGISFSDPDDSFYETGIAGYFHSSGRVFNLAVRVSDIQYYDDFIVLGNYSTLGGSNIYVGNLYGHSIAESNVSLYNRITGLYGGADAYAVGANGIRNITISREKAESLGFHDNSAVSPLDFSLIFPNFADIIEGVNTGVLNPTDEWWKARDFEDAVDLLSDAAAEAVAEGATDVPMDIPDVITEDDLPITDWADAEDFVDTTGVIAVDDETDFPDVPVNPGPSPDPDNPDRPDLPELHIPVLLTLFPFCIPFDIKRGIEWFGNSNNSNQSYNQNYSTGTYQNFSEDEIEEINGSGDPIFAIPLNIGVSGRPIVQTTLLLDLTEYNIPIIATWLKTIQVIAFVISLGIATYRFIY